MEPLDVQILQISLQVLPDGVEPKAGKLLNRLLHGPALRIYPVDGHHRAGPVGAVLAVDENGLVPRIGSDLEELDDILILGMPGSKMDVEVPEAEPLEHVPVGGDVTEGDHGADAQLLQLLKAFAGGLGATVEGRGDLGKVCEAGDVVAWGGESAGDCVGGNRLGRGWGACVVGREAGRGTSDGEPATRGERGGEKEGGQTHVPFAQPIRHKSIPQFIFQNTECHRTKVSGMSC